MGHGGALAGYRAGEDSRDAYFTSLRERRGALAEEAPPAAGYELKARRLGWEIENGLHGQEVPEEGRRYVSSGCGSARSDERLGELVRERLYQAGLDLASVTVRASDGDVLLEGRVPDGETRYRAEEYAERIAGVKEVDNRLKIGA